MGKTEDRYLFVLGFAEAAQAEAAIREIGNLGWNNNLKVVDWAIVTKSPDGKVSTRENTSQDPGAKRGAVAGGLAGALIAVAGPLGLGVVAASAGIGAVTAALRDSGFKDDDLKSVAGLMKDGRTVLILTVDTMYRDRLRMAIKDVPELVAADQTLESPVDGSSGNQLREAVEQYRSTHPSE
jgi:uncharacterized membrane protein